MTVEFVAAVGVEGHCLESGVNKICIEIELVSDGPKLSGERALPTNIRQPNERGNSSICGDFEISFDPVCLKPCQAYVKYEAPALCCFSLNPTTKSLKLLAIMALISLLTPANGAKWFYADTITHQSPRGSQNADRVTASYIQNKSILISTNYRPQSTDYFSLHFQYSLKRTFTKNVASSVEISRKIPPVCTLGLSYSQSITRL